MARHSSRSFLFVFVAALAATTGCSVSTTDGSTDPGGDGSHDDGKRGASDDDGGSGGSSGGGSDAGGGGGGGGGGTCSAPAAPSATDAVPSIDDDKDFTPTSALTDANGNAYAIGWLRNVGSATPSLFAARVKTDGTFDSSWGSSGKGYAEIDPEDDTGGLPGVEVGAVDAHGRLLVLFRHATVASSTVHTSLELVRLDASGRLDSSFGDGGRVRDLDAADETSKWGAAIATQGDTAFVFESIERSASLLGDPDKVLRGLSITSTGTIDSTYGFEGNAGTAEKAGAIGFGGGMYVSNGDRLWKLTPAGKIDSTYGTAGYVDGAEAPSAVAADGTTFFAPLAAAAIYSLGPSGTGQVTVFADLSAHALAVRCDGSVIVGETVLSGSESVQGTLLSSSGAEDASRGNAGTVTRSVDSSAYLFESGVSPVTVDPISGTVTAFAAKHATVQSLVALRVHP